MLSAGGSEGVGSPQEKEESNNGFVCKPERKSMPLEIVTDAEQLKLPAIEMSEEEAEKNLPLMREALAWIQDPRNKAVGLASRQVGSSGAWFVMKNPEKMWFGKNEGGRWIIVINPTMETVGKPTVRVEGCLSKPGVSFKVRRTNEVKAGFVTLASDGGLRYLYTTFTGLAAQVYQHESDHLRGKCIFSRQEEVPAEVAPETKEDPQ